MAGGTYLLQIPWELDAIGGVSQVVRNLAVALRTSHEQRAAVLIADWNAAHLQQSTHTLANGRCWRTVTAAKYSNSS
jgi:hypothetical protein